MVKLESKQLIGGHREELRGSAGRSGAGILIDIDEYQYDYKCNARGYEWSEKRVEDDRKSDLA